MSANSEYFEQPEGAPSVLKHALLRAYLPVFVGKTGRGSGDSRVFFVDGYAGPGRHADGTAGSPLLAIATARNMERSGRTLRCVFVEKHGPYADELDELLRAEARGLNWTVLRGDVAEHIDTITNLSRGAPAFWFLDPFGVSVAHEQVVAVMNRNGPRQVWPPTEVLLNFSAQGVWRIGGKLAKGIEDEDTYRLLDAACGGRWWRSAFVEAVQTHTPAAAARQVALAYRRRTEDATGSKGWLVEVKRRPTHEPIYYLLHFTRHPDGRWAFGNALSKAQEAWRAAWPLADRATRDARELEAGVLGLFDVSEVLDEAGFQQRMEAEWVDVIAANLARLLGDRRAFRVGDRQDEVFGTTLGLARDKHVRQAVKRLHSAGVTATNGTGENVQRMLILPAGAARVSDLPTVADARSTTLKSSTSSDQIA